MPRLDLQQHRNNLRRPSRVIAPCTWSVRHCLAPRRPGRMLHIAAECLAVDQILKNGARVGCSTSRTYRPFLHKMISLGYLDVELASPGTEVGRPLGRQWWRADKKFVRQSSCCHSNMTFAAQAREKLGAELRLRHCHATGRVPSSAHGPPCSRRQSRLALQAEPGVPTLRPVWSQGIARGHPVRDRVALTRESGPDDLEHG
jgi:hypothetical protein